MISGDQVAATRVVEDLLFQRWKLAFVYADAIGHCIAEIGTRWHNGNFSIATQHRATQIALQLLSRDRVQGDGMWISWALTHQSVR